MVGVDVEVLGTPGAAVASEVSTPSIRAWATIERTNTPWSAPSIAPVKWRS
jgi:hypothetical protein